MTVRTDALCTLDQLELAIGVNTADLAKREQAIDTATQAILDWTGRAVIHDSGGPNTITEFHDGESDWNHFYTDEFPITAASVTLHDDPDRVYGSGTLLTEGTHYLVYTAEGRIQLISSAGVSILTTRDKAKFNEGFQNIKITYDAGYLTNGVLPQNIRQGCIEWAAYILNTQAASGLREESLSLCTKVFANITKTGPPVNVKTLLQSERNNAIALV